MNKQRKRLENINKKDSSRKQKNKKDKPQEKMMDMILQKIIAGEINSEDDVNQISRMTDTAQKLTDLYFNNRFNAIKERIVIILIIVFIISVLCCFIAIILMIILLPAEHIMVNLIIPIIIAIAAIIRMGLKHFFDKKL